MNNKCFACGRENAQGLQLKIVNADDGVMTKFAPESWTQGYNQVVHGGIVSTILDEIAVWAAFNKGYKSATAELSVRIKKPMIVGNEYIALGRVVNIKKGRIIEVEAQIKDKEETIIAQAQVKLVKID